MRKNNGSLTIFAKESTSVDSLLSKSWTINEKDNGQSILSSQNAKIVKEPKQFVYMKKVNANICQRCEAPFACKADDITNCQCASVTISTKTQQYLSSTNYGCLCKNCLVKINQQIENGINV